MNLQRLSSVTIVLLISVLNFQAIGASTASVQPSSLPTSLTFSRTLLLHGGSTVTPLNLSIGKVKTSGHPTITIDVLTPTLPGTGPSEPQIISPQGSILWEWPSTFGYIYGLQNSTGLLADNATVSSEISLPVARLLQATAVVQSVRGSLTGNYSLELSVHGLPVLSRNGTQAFLPPAPLSWATPVSGTPVSAVASANEPNGSELLGIGDEFGMVTVYSLSPGLNGSEVFNGSVEVSARVSSMISSDLFSTGVSELLAGTGQDVMVIGESSGNRLQASATQISWNRSSSTYPTVFGVATAPSLSTSPSILALTDEGSLQESTWELQGIVKGWATPMTPIDQLAFSPTCFSSSHDSTTGVTTLAIGGANSLMVYNYSGTSLNSVANDSITSGDFPTAAVFLNGTLFIGTSSGALWAYAPPYDHGKELISAEGSSVTAMTALGNGAGLVLGYGDGNLALVRDFSGSAARSTNIGYASFPGGVAGIGVASIFGTNEQDLLFPGSSTLYAAMSQLSFNATPVANWASDLSAARKAITSTSDSYGNLFSNIPVTLAANGGSVRLTNSYIDYNLSRNITLTQSQVSSVFTGNQTAGQLDFAFRSSSNGYIHVIVALSWGGPPTSGQGILPLLMDWFLKYSAEIAFTVFIIGSAVFIVGFSRYGVRYRRTTKSRPLTVPNGATKRSSSRNQKRG